MEGSPRQARTGERNLVPDHFTCDGGNSLIWVEEEEEFKSRPPRGEPGFLKSVRAGMVDFVRKRLLSAVMVLGTGFDEDNPAGEEKG